MRFPSPSLLPQKTWLAAALLVLAVAVPGRALGAEPAAPDAPTSTRVWYGWQSAIIDAAAVGTILPLVLRREQDAVWILAFVGPPAYAVGAPIVHFAHDNVPKGLASLGLRLAMPPVVGFLGSLTCGTDNRGRCFIGITGGAMLAAMVLDDALLAFEDAPVAPSPSRAALRLRPSFSTDGHGVVAGLSLTM